MTFAADNVCVATLGGQPQIITLLLDALHAQGKRMESIRVVHLALEDPRYQAALSKLWAEFPNDRYADHQCSFLPVLIRQQQHPIADLATDDALDAVRDTFDSLFHELKHTGKTIHLCLSGGPRLLGYLAMAMAYKHFQYSDRAWHLYSSKHVRAQTHEGAIMHLPRHPEVHLLRAPLEPLGALSAADAAMVDPAEMQRCREVWQQLSKRNREVLSLLASGHTPTEVGQELALNIKTVDSHKTTIFVLCRNAWDLPLDTYISFHWLHKHFASFCQQYNESR